MLSLGAFKTERFSREGFMRCSKVRFFLTLFVLLSKSILANPLCRETLQSIGMEYVDLVNRSGERRVVSRLVMGTDHLVQGNWTHEGQAEPSEEQAFKVLDEAAKHGINFFDTSPIYVGDV